MRSGVKDRYLPTAQQKKNAHLLIGKWFRNMLPNIRRAEEEPFQWAEAQELARLKEVISDFEMFLVIWRSRAQDLLVYWGLFSREEVVDTYELAYSKWMRVASKKLRPELTVALADAIFKSGIFCSLGSYLHVSAARRVARILGPKSLTAADRLIHSAYYLRQLADPSALRYAKRAVSLIEEFGKGTVSSALLSGWICLALNLDAAGEEFEAKKFAEMSLAGLAKIPKTEDPTLISHEITLGWFFSSMAHLARAESILKKLILREETVFGREHRATLETVDCLVGCLLGQEKYADASNLAMSLYLRCYRSLGERDVSTAFAAGKFGKASLALGDIESAEWGLSKAHEILIEVFPPLHQHSRLFLMELAVTYDRAGKIDLAEKTRRAFSNAVAGVYLYSPP